MVGRELLKALMQRNMGCIATSRTEPQSLPTDTKWRQWDLEKWKTSSELDDLFPGVDAVIHAGAAVVTEVDNPEFWRHIFDVNVRATLCLGSWAFAKRIPFVFLSSASVYANPEKRGILESAPKTVRGIGGFYGLSKSMAEDVLLHFAGEGLRVCILRPSSVYGFGLPERKMVTSFLMQASSNSTIELSPPTDDEIDLLHVVDVANAALKALAHEAWGVYNVSSGTPATIAEIAGACVKVAGHGLVVVKSVHAARRPTSRFLLNNDAARKAFGFSPSLSLEAGLARMLQDLKGNSDK